jgi:small conductance mechanosensitive channel
MHGVLNTDGWGHFWQTHAENLVVSAGKIAVIIVAYIVLRILIAKLIKGVLNSTLAKRSGEILQARKARVRALQSVLISTVGFVLAFIAGIMIAEAAGINILPLVTTASVAGLAIGFGAQKLVKDVISGFFILVEDQYGVGDYVTIGAVSGVVEDLEMRTTRVRDGSGKLYILSNGDISQVCNHSRGKLTMIVDFGIAPTADIDRARQTLDEVGQSVAADFPKEVKEAFKCDGLSQITAASTAIRMVGAVAPQSQEKIRTELNSRVREALQKQQVALA